MICSISVVLELGMRVSFSGVSARRVITKSMIGLTRIEMYVENRAVKQLNVSMFGARTH
jgi:hypothetical protein